VSVLLAFWKRSWFSCATAPAAAFVQSESQKIKAEWGLFCLGEENYMTRLLEGRVGIALLASALLLSTMASAQQKSTPQRNLSYEVSREVSVQGSVISYSETSSVAPFGPRVTLQTGSGVVDVHLGNARLLESSHFTLAPGDSVRVVGESVPFGTGTQFLARIVQKGNQTLALRSAQGFPLRPAATSADGKGAL